jgi:glycosyltransferase involved in cell wall biosynthesis
MYPGLWNTPNPYWILLKNALEKISPGTKVFLDTLFQCDYNNTQLKPGAKMIIHIHWIPEMRYPAARFSYRLGRFQTDLIYYRKIIKQFLMMRALKKNRNAKIIWTVHDADNSFASSSRPTWTSFFLFWTKILADGYIFHCQSAKKEFLETNKNKFSSVIPHGNYIDHYGPIIQNRNDAKALLGLQSEEVTFLIMGWIRKSKNLSWLIPRLRELPHHNIRFIIAGFPQDQAKWLTAEFFKDRRFILMPRFIPDHQLRWLLAASDFLLNAQMRGYVSGSTITALSYGLPVIGINWGCASTLISHGKNGFLFTNENIVAVLKQAIATRHSASRYTAMRRAAFASMQQKVFTWESIAEKTLSAYQSISRSVKLKSN